MRESGSRFPQHQHNVIRLPLPWRPRRRFLITAYWWQDNVELTGPTAHGERPPYKAMPEKLPLALQDHGNPVRFRNNWIRELKTGE
jgi:hypothetical protein